MSKQGESPAAAIRRTGGWNWKAALRTLHRDLGCIALGLTFVYALSGIAVNHLKDWDPNFTDAETQHRLQTPVPTDTRELVEATVAKLGITAAYADPNRPWFEPYAGGNIVEVSFAGGGQIIIDRAQGTVTERTREPRFMLRAMNWLHIQRGKPAWNWIGDSYAIVLMVLAVTGLFLLPKGGRGILGRGGLLVLIGILIPMLYLMLSGGPEGMSVEEPEQSGSRR